MGSVFNSFPVENGGDRCGRRPDAPPVDRSGIAQQAAGTRKSPPRQGAPGFSTFSPDPAATTVFFLSPQRSSY
jgi:hypothetical protein